MPTTKIKIDSATRDRLSQLTRARRTTMSALLSDVAERLETEQRWSEIEAAYERMQHEDPEGWTEYLGELAEWELSTAITDQLGNVGRRGRTTSRPQAVVAHIRAALQS